MQKSFQVFNRSITLEFYGATVIHANKYTESQGGAFNLPVTSTLHTDVVFRLTDTNENFQMYINNVNLPLYTNQEVTLLSSENKVLGFIDNQTNNYYYTTKNLSKALQFNVPFYWVIIIGVFCAGVALLLNGGRFSPELLLPFLCAWALHYLQKVFLNFKIKRAVDRCLNN